MTDDTVDYGRLMQIAAEAHLERVWTAFYTEEETGLECESPAVGPFCGCETCVVRETLAGAWPVIAEHFLPSLAKTECNCQVTPTV